MRVNGLDQPFPDSSKLASGPVPFLISRVLERVGDKRFLRLEVVEAKTTWTQLSPRGEHDRRSWKSM